MKSREQGAIATFNGAFAFIRPDGADKDVFAHASELPTGPIHGDDSVTFDIAPDPFKPGKMRAVAVRFINVHIEQTEKVARPSLTQNAHEQSLTKCQ